MFDFAISQYQKRRLTRRVVFAWALSCAAHLGAVLLLIAYPGLLMPGLNRWLRHPIVIGNGPSDEEWRTVTFVGKGGLREPSAETLRRNTYDWEAAAAAKAPTIRLRWGNELDTQAQPQDKPSAAIRPVPGLQEPKQAPPEQLADAQPTALGPGQGDGVPSGAARGDDSSGPAGRSPTVYLPPPVPSPPEPPKVADAGAAPRAIPKSVEPPPPAPSSQPTGKPDAAQAQSPATPKPQVFENEQKAIRSEGTGLFDTKGFPLGDYANVIIERIKGNWYIPSNLRSSQGRTTVIFFIGKDGRYTNAHIVTSSGSTSLDLAALNAVLVSNPFPPLPNGFPGEQVGAKFVFSYNERP